MNKVIFQLLKKKKAQSKIAIVIRHAEREKIFDVLDSFETPLVEKGIKESVMFGVDLLKDLSYRISHSIVPRCKQTAEYILKGIQEKDKENKSYIVGVKDFLAGFFLKDVEYILNLVNKINGKEFIEKWYDDRISKDKIRSFRSSAYMQLDYIMQELDTKKENLVDIYVTHDWNVILLQSFIFNIRDNLNWPDYFESIVIENDNDNLIIYNRNRSKKFALTDLKTYKNNYVI